MIRLAARCADQWDTFPELPGTATDGVTTDLAERVRAFEDACRDAGRDPGSIRRSTWAEGDVATSEAAFVGFVRQHRALGFTDFSVVPQERDHRPVLERIARDRIPELRAEFAASAT